MVRGFDLRIVGKRQEPVTSIFAFRKDTPVYSLEVDLQRWFLGGEGEIVVVEF